MLSFAFVERRMWHPPATKAVQLYADARGHPPRLAAVVVCDGRISYTDWEPPERLMQFFKKRKDNQIQSLELLALALGLCTFTRQCKGRKVQLYSDNTGAEHSTKKGSAKEWDHSAIVHSIWMKAAKVRLSVCSVSCF